MRIGDAYGEMLLAAFEGREATEIVERDDGYVDATHSGGVYLAPFAEWWTAERRAARFIRGRVLDVGCGGGRVALHLQDCGHEVVAIDNSPGAVEVCRRRGVDDVRMMSVTQVSRKALGTFDTIVMYGNNLGLLADRRRARWLLRRFHGMTAPDGRIVAETMDVHDTDNPDHLAYHRRNVARGRMPGQIRLRVRHHSLATSWFDYLMVSRDELNDLVEGTGWTVRRTVDGSGPMYVAILEKR